MDYDAIRDFIDRIAATIKEFYALLSKFVSDMKNKTLEFNTDHTVNYPDDYAD